MPKLLLIFLTPSSPSSSGMSTTACGSAPYSFCRVRPIRILNFWSVPPISISVLFATESIPCIRG
ncbi:hypothetical protein D3C81_2025850 [compost metagenome]